MRNCKKKRADLILIFLLAIYFVFISAIFLITSVIIILNMNIANVFNWAQLVINLILTAICVYCSVVVIRMIVYEFKQTKEKKYNND